MLLPPYDPAPMIDPILYGAKDFTCTVMSPRAEVLSMHDCLPIHVGTMDPALRFVIRACADDIRDGDVIVNNASFAGNAHVGDWTMYAPIFYEDQLVAWAANKLPSSTLSARGYPWPQATSASLPSRFIRSTRNGIRSRSPITTSSLSCSAWSLPV